MKSEKNFEVRSAVSTRRRTVVPIGQPPEALEGKRGGACPGCVVGRGQSVVASLSRREERFASARPGRFPGLWVFATPSSQTLRLRLPRPCWPSGLLQTGLPNHSGGTTADSHGLPFTPVMGT